MSDSRVEVLPVPEGSIVWLHNIDILDAAMFDEAAGQMRKAIGHDRFVILSTNGDGVVEVLGPDELVERVRATLEPEVRRLPEEWESIVGITVKDPDGWRAEGRTWNHPVTRAEFERLAAESTVGPS